VASMWPPLQPDENEDWLYYIPYVLL
jgi:hypothetical protein